jgi:cytoskeletal protein RodZ
VAVTGIGDQLREERLRQSLTLDDIVQRTRIPIRSLEAIEANAFDRLPGLVFARNFVRMYAVELKLDSEPLLAGLPRVDIDAAPMPHPPAGTDPHWDPRLSAALASAIWVITAAVAAGGAWYYFNHYGRHSATTVASSPAPKPAAPLRAVNAKSEQAASAPAASPAEGFDGGRPVQVILTAREAAWVQVSADGRTAFVGILHPNDTRTIAADDQVKILTGNAGGLDISLNGKALDPIGPSGQVRTVRLTAEGPQFAPKNPPASSPL